LTPICLLHQVDEAKKMVLYDRGRARLPGGTALGMTGGVRRIAQPIIFFRLNIGALANLLTTSLGAAANSSKYSAVSNVATFSA